VGGGRRITGEEQGGERGAATDSGSLGGDGGGEAAEKARGGWCAWVGWRGGSSLRRAVEGGGTGGAGCGTVFGAGGLLCTGGKGGALGSWVASVKAQG